MNTNHKLLTIALGVTLAGAAAAQTVVLAEPEVRTIVTRSGYADPLVIERDHDLWRVRSLSPAGEKVTLFVNADGEVIGAADVARTRIVETTTTTTTEVAPAPVPAPDPIHEGDVAALLVDAGFHDVHDVEYRDGVWKAEADDITGDDLEIHVDASTGLIVHVEDD